MSGRYVSSLVGSCALALTLLTGQSAVAHQTIGEPFDHVHSDDKRVIRGERYVPTIWVDPDGCEHWVMDDGWEGFMSPKLDRNGMPTCHTSTVCGRVPSDQMFATDSARIHRAGKTRLTEFFNSTDASAYIIVGHTDSRASDEYNMALSQRRASAVASVGKAAGARILSVRGYGERQPIASNSTHAGMAKNRRVEILCVR